VCPLAETSAAVNGRSFCDHDKGRGVPARRNNRSKIQGFPDLSVNLRDPLRKRFSDTCGAEKFFLHTRHVMFGRDAYILNDAKGDPVINNMVLSSEIEWIGYEHKRNMLQVEFIVGSVYQYEGVPEVVYKDFLTAPSHGRFFESNIKGKYQYRKVR